jgi:hypothetical protein
MQSILNDTNRHACMNWAEITRKFYDAYMSLLYSDMTWSNMFQEQPSNKFLLKWPTFYKSELMKNRFAFPKKHHKCNKFAQQS